MEKMGLLHYEVFTTHGRWEKLISCKVVYEDFALVISGSK
jgi:hypothetical protein